MNEHMAKFDRNFKRMAVVSLVLWVGAVAGIGAVAWHFIAKLW